MSRVAVVGAAGQLGTELVRQLGRNGAETIPFDRSSFDVTDADSAAAVLGAARPELVVNATAYNFVDRAEAEPHAAFAANALGPRNLALWCAANRVTLLHVSTDYVYGGSPEESARRLEARVPYLERDAALPPNAYGVSKLAGEHFVRSLCPRHFVVRTCGLSGRAAGSKGNFVETMLRLGGERRELRVVDDQHCTPTSVTDLAAALVALVRTDAYGLYHATNAGATTWCGFAREIFTLAGLDVVVRPVTSAEYGAKARRPAYSVLDSSRLEGVLGRPLPPWRDGLSAYLAERSAN
jgi:dTDP-4-dehydrorhamnose reductase